MNIIITNVVGIAVKALIHKLAGSEYYYFDAAIKIKATPHSPVFDIWGCCLSPDGVIYVMDAEQKWYPLTPGKGNADILISSLFQRLKTIAKTQNIIA